jgi:histidinol phosphatase-like enzyme
MLEFLLSAKRSSGAESSKCTLDAVYWCSHYQTSSYVYRKKSSSDNLLIFLEQACSIKENE